jgi:hypothetical protein
MAEALWKTMNDGGFSPILRAIPLQTPAQLAATFTPARRARVQEILETLTALGQARFSEGRCSL